MKITLFHFQKRKVYPDGFTTTLHKYFIIDSFGIWFSRKGEEVGWVWPWKREGKPYTRWYVTGLCTSFPSFKAIDKFWQEYFEECERVRTI